MEVTKTSKFSPRPSVPTVRPSATSLTGNATTGRGEIKSSNPFEAIPPHDPIIERYCLGSMLMARYACEYCIAMLVPEHFYIQRNQWLFGKFVIIFRGRKTLDEKIVIANIGPVKNLNEIRDYVGRLIIDTPSATEVEAYADGLQSLLWDRKRLNFALKIVREITAAMPAVARK